MNKRICNCYRSLFSTYHLQSLPLIACHEIAQISKCPCGFTYCRYGTRIANAIYHFTHVKDIFRKFLHTYPNILVIIPASCTLKHFAMHPNSRTMIRLPNGIAVAASSCISDKFNPFKYLLSIYCVIGGAKRMNECGRG